MLGFTVPHEFLIQHGSIACASCCSFCLVAWFTQRKGNETKVCITSDVCTSVRTARSGRESSARMPANARASDWISDRPARAAPRSAWKKNRCDERSAKNPREKNRGVGQKKRRGRGAPSRLNWRTGAIFGAAASCQTFRAYVWTSKWSLWLSKKKWSLWGRERLAELVCALIGNPVPKHSQ